MSVLKEGLFGYRLKPASQYCLLLGKSRHEAFTNYSWEEYGFSTIRSNGFVIPSMTL